MQSFLNQYMKQKTSQQLRVSNISNLSNLSNMSNMNNMNNDRKSYNRVMAIDYGDARTGVAVSDMSATLTGDAWVLHEKRTKVLASIILEEAKTRGVGKIVVGFPKNMDGTIGFRAKATEAFVKDIENLIRNDTKTTGSQPIDIEFWDERLTTKMADAILINAGKRTSSNSKSRSKKQKSSVDAVAASLILESYLSRTGAGNH